MSIWFPCAGGSTVSQSAPKLLSKIFNWTVTKPAPSPFVWNLQWALKPKSIFLDSSLLRHGTFIFCVVSHRPQKNQLFQNKWLHMRGSRIATDVLDVDMAGQGHPWSTSTPGRRTSTAVISSPFSSSETCTLYHLLDNPRKQHCLSLHHTLCCKPLWLFGCSWLIPLLFACANTPRAD